MAQQTPPRFIRYLADLSGRNQEDAMRIFEIIHQMNAASWAKLDQLAHTAYWRDAFAFFVKSLIVYLPIFLYDVALRKITPLVAAYNEAHGKHTAGAFLLAISLTVAIPAIGLTAAQLGTAKLRPRYGLPDIPQYQRPGIDAGFPSIVVTPKTAFVVLSPLFPACCALLGSSTLLGLSEAEFGFLIAIKQTFDAWRVFRSQSEVLHSAFAPHDGKTRFRQPWLGKDEIRNDLRSLLDHRWALTTYMVDLFDGLLKNAIGNLLASLTHPSTFATAAALIPSAACAQFASFQTGEGERALCHLLSRLLLFGSQGTLIGMTSQPDWEWLLEQAGSGFAIVYRWFA